MSVRCLRLSRSGVSPNDAGGRSPAVVSVIAGMPRADERALLVEGEREAEVGELPERGRPPRPGAGLFCDPRGGRLDERRRGRASLVAAELDPGRRATGDRVEVDDSDDLSLVALGEPRRSEPAEGAAVRGEEEQRVGRHDCAAARPREAARTPARARSAPPSRRRCRSLPARARCCPGGP